jgi:O-phospho-L-seryl-tRNASec:L-selenocysteinyl-tRNA synthase
MNARNAELAAALVPATYVQQGVDAIRNREALLTTLLSQRRVPDEPWDELSIELLLQQLAAMDSNNFRTNIGAGEREARVFSSLVAKRHFFLCHGVGRSGDVAAVQPKAAGSSLLVQLSNALARDILRDAGLRLTAAAVVLPVATGMSLTLVLLALKTRKPEATYVIWPRIDQKSCLKSILSAGLTPLVVENVLEESGQLRTDVDAVQQLFDQHGSASVLAVMTTTSCFAPRGMDRLVEIATLCRDYDVAHVVNNAYGVQSPKCMHAVNEATRVARVDAVVQSLDKNFLMPVGGAIVSSSKKELVHQVAQVYPGRASNSPSVDFFITMLHMGRTAYRKLLRDRKELAVYLKTQLQQVASECGERVIESPQNEVRSILVGLVWVEVMFSSRVLICRSPLP